MFLAMSLLVANESHSQIANESPVARAINAVQQSDFIFEGIIKSQSYYLHETEHGRYGYTANTVQITRIFKDVGQINCGEILLIHRGTSN
jgi:hypothetical protein